MRRVLLVVSLSMSLVVIPGCKGDPATPEYWQKAIASAKRKKDKVRVVEDLRSSKKMTPAFLPMLHKELESEKGGEVRASIARVLGETKDPSSVESLLGAIDFGANDSEDKASNKEIVVALGAIGDKKAAPTLIKLLGVRDN